MINPSLSNGDAKEALGAFRGSTIGSITGGDVGAGRLALATATFSTEATIDALFDLQRQIQNIY